MGDTIAGRNIANLYAYCTLEQKDYAEGLEWNRKAAGQGNAAAMLRIGLFYHEGWAVNINYDSCLKWYSKAAELGNAAAIRNIGGMFKVGHSVNQDYEEALKWYLRAAEKNDAIAIKNIGIFYYKGWAVQKNIDAAMGWLSKAAELGNEEAKNYLLKIKNIENSWSDYSPAVYNVDDNN